jgi:hypothetical protein
LGGSWVGTTIRFLYICRECEHKALLETEDNLSSIYLASWLLILFGVTLSLFLSKPDNLLFSLIWGVLGGAGIYSVHRLRNTYPVEVASDNRQPTKVAVEERISLSQGERERSVLWDRYTTWAVYGVISIAALVIVFEWLVG